MKKTAAIFGVASVVLAVAANWVVSQESTIPNETGIPGDNIETGKALYDEYCAACHGVNLEGQPEWRSAGTDGRLPAPPHNENGHTWHHSDQIIFNYTKLGGREMLASQGIEFESGMPGFGDTLNDDEIWSILAYIKSTWPERERQIQAERTDSENQ